MSFAITKLLLLPLLLMTRVLMSLLNKKKNISNLRVGKNINNFSYFFSLIFLCLSIQFIQYNWRHIQIFYLFIFVYVQKYNKKKTSITHRQKYLFNRGEICFMKMKLLLVGFLFAIISTANSMRFANEL